jgi:hypothetical protein
MFPYSVTGSSVGGTTSTYVPDPTLPGRDIAINFNTGRWIISNLDATLTKGKDAIKQAIDLRLNLFVGEYFPDITEGTPWYESVFVKPISVDIVASILRTRILAVPGVISCDVVKFSLDPSTRNASIEYSVTTDVGLIVSSTKVTI